MKLKPKKLHGSEFLWGAHHPHCERHDHHLLWIKKHPYCLGCVCLYTGLIGGILVFALIYPMQISFLNWLGINIALLVPTVFQPFIQKKSYKVVSRWLLGLCIASYFLSGFFITNLPVNSWIFRISQIGMFALIFSILTWIRNSKIDNPCNKCPLGNYPVCEWNLPRLLDHPEQNLVFSQLIASNHSDKNEKTSN